jgi:predicted N-acetyltransferase YhbS
MPNNAAKGDHTLLFGGHLKGDGKKVMRQLDQEHAGDAPAIDALLDDLFGADRFGRTAYRFRDHCPPLQDMGFVMREGDRLLASVRFWPLLIRAVDFCHDGLLLGPLAVAKHSAGTGAGTALMRHGLDLASAKGLGPVFLIGDPGYYGRVGFRPVLPKTCHLPGPFDATRLLYHPAGGPFGNLDDLPDPLALEPVKQ